MGFVSIALSDGVAVVTLRRGKVNAINEAVVDELHEAVEGCMADGAVRGLVLTGSGPFFSFGFDVPGLYDLSPDEFTTFLRKYTRLCKMIFAAPKPVVAAINGHAVAGGCILATACDARFMVTGKAAIALNELTFGATVFQTAVELMRHCVGSRVAEDVLYGGKMYSGDQACAIGLVDAVVSPDDLLPTAIERASALAGVNLKAFAQTKAMLHRPIIDRIKKYEDETIDRFIDIWYSEPIRTRLKEITIRG